MHLPVMALLLFGCPRGFVGVEEGFGDRPSYVTATGEIGMFASGFGAGATLQTRLGATGVEASLGGFVCGGTQTRVTFEGCARVYALELGWRRDHMSFGLVAPAIGPSLTIPLRDGAPISPSRQAVTGTALTIGLWAGLDTRVAPRSDFGPYISLQVGVGNMVHPPKPRTH